MYQLFGQSWLAKYICNNISLLGFSLSIPCMIVFYSLNVCVTQDMLSNVNSINASVHLWMYDPGLFLWLYYITN